MQIIESIKDIQIYHKKHKKLNKVIAFVPTMGNLHEGHLSLVKIAQKHADIVLVSIFLNPLQFSAKEDINNYPKTIQDDLNKLKALKVSAVFTPNVTTIYPDGKSNAPRIYIKEFETMLCAVSRPDFFSGVATVVTALFNIIKPDIAIFGEKDYQQLLVIKKLVKNLHFNIKILSGKIVREPSGLAMSSRNNYFSESQRAQAAMLYKLLNNLKNNIINNSENVTNINKYILDSKESFKNNNFEIDYIEVRSNTTLNIITDYNSIKKNSSRLFIACNFYGVRLIDNINLQ